MAALNQATKVFIVTRLACFDQIQEVVKATRDELGVTVSRQQVQSYDPTGKMGERLSPKLTELFHETRKKFLDDTSAIPIANKAVRLRMLQRAADKAVEKGNSVLMASLVEQAAKEVGDAFTNKQKVEQSGVVGSVPVPAPKGNSQTAEDAYKAMLGGQRA